jgi:hypothetical protein
MAKLPEGAVIVSTPAPTGAEVVEPVNEPGKFVPEPWTQNPPQQDARINPVAGTFEALGQGATFGGGDELQAAMAAVTAKIAPLFDENFIQDKTLAQLYADAVSDIRAKRRQFREQNPAASMIAEGVGTLATGGSGIARLAPAAHPWLGAAAVGAGEGAVAGTLSADADEFWSLDTLTSAGIGFGAGGVAGFAFPLVQALAVQGAKVLPKAAKSLFTTKSALKRKYIAQLESGDGLDDDMAKYIIDGAGRLKTNKLLPEAVAQGWHPGTVNYIAGSKPADREAFTQMLDLVKRGMANRAFRKAPKNHPRRVVGESFLKRLSYIKDKNTEASKEISRIAQSKLKGTQINLQKPVSEFADVLESNGLILNETFGINKNGKFFVNFDNSPFTPKDRGPIREVLKQMSRLSRGGADAADAHELKRIIDNNVTWGKGDSMSGEAASMLKDFRRGIDEVLDITFPDYNAANTQYKETIEVLEDVVGLMGKRIDIDSASANQSLGRELRKIFGNTKVAEGLNDLVEHADNVAVNYGAEFDDSVMAQLHFFDDLSERLGPFESTSFRAEIGRGNVDAARRTGQLLSGEKTATGFVLETGEWIANNAKNVSDDGAIEVIEKLIRQVNK